MNAATIATDNRRQETRFHPIGEKVAFRHPHNHATATGWLADLSRHGVCFSAATEDARLPRPRSRVVVTYLGRNLGPVAYCVVWARRESGGLWRIGCCRQHGSRGARRRFRLPPRGSGLHNRAANTCCQFQ